MIGESSTAGAHALGDAAIAFLRRYPPFDAMEEEPLRAGECFSLGALLERRPVMHAYVAAPALFNARSREPCDERAAA